MLALTMGASATVVVQETFAYADGDVVGYNGGIDWASAWEAGNATNGTTKRFNLKSNEAIYNGTGTVGDRFYRVNWATSMANTFQTLENNIEQPQNSYTDSLHNAESKGFCKGDARLK